MKKVGGLLLAFVFLFCLSALPAIAADTEMDQLKGEVQKLLKKIEDLEKKQQESEKKFESVEKAATKLEQEEVQLQADKKQKALAYWKDGFFIETPDKKFRLQIGGQVHFDTRLFAEDKAGESKSSFDIRRARYDMRGSMYAGDIEHVFRLQVEMADSPLVQNAYWILKFRPEFNLMIGQFKPPVNSSDRMTEEGHMNFVEFGVDVPLTAYYDRGVNIISKFLNDKVQTCVGVINGVGADADNGVGDLDNNKNYFARLLLNPFKDTGISALKEMYFVGSIEDGLQSIKTARGETNFRTENYESQWFQWTQNNVNINDRERYGAEFHWILGPLSASYEYNRVQWDNIKVFKSATGPLSFTLPGEHHVDVQQVWVSYFLTGEKKTYEDVFFAWRQPKPKKNFSLKDGTWGAFEVIGRYKKIDASDDLFTQQPKDKTSVILSGVQEGYTVTGGLRWIWNPKVRVMLDANYLHSDKGQGIITQSSKIAANDTKGFVDNETGFLLRFILQL